MVLYEMKNIQEFQKLCQDGVINANGSVQLDSAQKYIRSMEKAILYCDKLLYLETLKRTEENNVLENLICEGLLGIFSRWLDCAINPLMHQCATIIMKMLSQVPVKMNSLGLDKVVTAVKKYKTIKSTSNCPEKECIEVRNYASQTIKILRNKCKSKEVKKKENKVVKKLPQPNNGFTMKKSAIENTTKLNFATKRCLVETPDNNGSNKASNSKPPPPKIKKAGLSNFLDDIMKEQLAALPKKKRPAKKPISAKQPTPKPAENKVVATSIDENFNDDVLPTNDEINTDSVRIPTYGKNGKPKKVLSWADSSGIDLEEIRYFEVMPGERVNVNNENFKEALEKERQRERLRQGDVDGNVWVKPKKIILDKDFSKAMENWGQFSEEKDTQAHRESLTLMAIYLTPQMIPDSPAEPDPEDVELEEPMVIPFLNQDNSVSSNINSSPSENTKKEITNLVPLLNPSNGNLPVVPDNMQSRHQPQPHPNNSMINSHIPPHQFPPYMQPQYMQMNRHPAMNRPRQHHPMNIRHQSMRHIGPRHMFHPQSQRHPLRRPR